MEGRSDGRKNLKTLLIDALNELVVVTEASEDIQALAVAFARAISSTL